MRAAELSGIDQTSDPLRCRQLIDPSQVANFRDLVRGLANRHAVLLSTHILDEVDAICDRVAVIHQDRTVL